MDDAMCSEDIFPCLNKESVDGSPTRIHQPLFQLCIEQVRLRSCVPFRRAVSKQSHTKLARHEDGPEEDEDGLLQQAPCLTGGQKEGDNAPRRCQHADTCAATLIRNVAWGFLKKTIPAKPRSCHDFGPETETVGLFYQRVNVRKHAEPPALMRSLPPVCSIS